MSATGSNGNENTAGPDPEEPQAHRERGTAAGADRASAGAGVTGFADLAEMRAAILRAERARPAGAAGAPAGRDAALAALMRARRDRGAAAAPGGSGLGAGPGGSEEALSEEALSARGADSPLRSRSGGVNRPRPVVPTPLLAAEAVRLVDSAHTKRARMVSAIGLPAVFLAATGVAVMPTVANAASASSAPSSTTSCAPGSSTVTNQAAPKTSAPSSTPSTPGSSASKPGAAPTPGAPQPSSSGSTPQQPAPSSRPSSAPPSATAPPTKPVPTTAPTGSTAPPTHTATSVPSSAPSSAPSSSPSNPWWDPLGLLGTVVNGVFNPAPSSSPTTSTVNKLAAAPAAPSSNPTSSPTPLLSIGLGGSSSSPSSAPSSKPSSNPTTPSTPQPTSSGASGSSQPSAPATPPSSAPSTPSSSASTPSSSPSGPPSEITYGGQTYQLPTTACVTDAPPTALREVKWHLDASKLTLTNQTFKGFQKINTGDGKTVTVMVIHADRVDLTDMVTYNEDGNTKIYSDGGKGKDVSLTNVTLHVLQQKGVMDLPILGIPLGQVTLGPPGEAGTDVTSQLVMGLLELNLPLPPVTFTDVHVDQYTLTSDTLNIPHFNVSLNGITPQS